MTLSMHQASAPLFRQGLDALAAVLDKAVAQCAERKIDPAVLLADRLAPDMFPFTRQVQLACDFAKNTCRASLAASRPGSRTSRPPCPSCRSGSPARWRWWRRSGRRGRRCGGSHGHAVDRRPDHELPGQDYLLHFALPNFFFHLTAAYLILRHNGIQIGKRDFIGAIPGM